MAQHVATLRCGCTQIRPTDSLKPIWCPKHKSKQDVMIAKEIMPR